jgi:hypothetical protein
MKKFALLVMLTFPCYAFADAVSDTHQLDNDAQFCYGYAMVGYDSVINSRLGLPAENTLGLALKNPLKETAEERYHINVLKIALNAYMWKGDPHDYAVQVLYNCAKAKGDFLDAKLDW